MSPKSRVTQGHQRRGNAQQSSHEKGPLGQTVAYNRESDATVHDFHSTFRDWASDETPFARDIMEMALAHAIKNKTEAAYRRSTALAKRPELMTAWDAYLSKANT